MSCSVSLSPTTFRLTLVLILLLLSYKHAEGKLKKQTKTCSMLASFFSDAIQIINRTNETHKYASFSEHKIELNLAP